MPPKKHRLSVGQQLLPVTGTQPLHIFGEAVIGGQLTLASDVKPSNPWHFRVRFGPRVTYCLQSVLCVLQPRLRGFREQFVLSTHFEVGT